MRKSMEGGSKPEGFSLSPVFVSHVHHLNTEDILLTYGHLLIYQGCSEQRSTNFPEIVFLI